MLEFITPEFWIAVGQIILIDILLGGDNAVVIALACRQLPEGQRMKGIMWGTAGAIGLRVVLIAFALTLLSIPYLKIVGGALLVWIGVKLMMPDDEGDHSVVDASDKLWAALITSWPLRAPRKVLRQITKCRWLFLASLSAYPSSFGAANLS